MQRKSTERAKDLLKTPGTTLALCNGETEILSQKRGVAPLAPDSDRTVVRPTFSSLGSYSISDEAILDLIKIVLKDVPGFAEVTSFKTEKQTYGVMISLDIALYYGYDAQEVLETAQQRVGSAVEEFTSITMNSVNVRANRLIHMTKSSDPEE